jgi:hypothetical protein
LPDLRSGFIARRETGSRSAIAQQLVAAIMLHEFGSIPGCPVPSVFWKGLEQCPRGAEFWGVGTDFSWQHE